MKIDNIEKKQYFELIEKYVVDGYTTYEISGKNNFFSGKSTICLSNSKITDFKKKLKDLFVWREIQIDDNDSDAYIKIKKSDDLWHYDIIYQIWWSHQDNFSKLILNTDQIGIKKILDF